MRQTETPAADDPAGGPAVTPDVIMKQRRPGEVIFAALLVAASLVLAWNAYGIAGFRSMSSPGAVPMATTAAMVVTSVLILAQTLRRTRRETETLRHDILPGVVLGLVLMLVLYGLALRIVGFVPTTFVFLVLTIRVLSGRSLVWTLGVSVVALAVIWVLFRMVFTVLLPAGIFPEAALIQFLRSLTGRG